jgi:multiple sugar transport system permease protein
MRDRSRFRSVMIAVLAIVMVAATVFPYVWILLTSIKPDAEIFTPDFHYLPQHATLDNYRQLLISTPIARYFVNSTIVASLSTMLALTVAVSAAYSFSRFRFRGRQVLMTLFLVIPMFPTVLILVPLFVIMRTLNLLGTYWALLVAYTTFVIPFSVWMLTGFFDGFPVDLEEAGMVDGCTRMGAVARILLPLALPGLIATGIYIFIVAWNEFLFALMFTTQQSRTLPVGLYSFIGEYSVQWGLLTACGVVVTIPVVTLFFLVQGHLIRGLTSGAIKG